MCGTSTRQIDIYNPTFGEDSALDSTCNKSKIIQNIDIQIENRRKQDEMFFQILR